MHAKNYLCDGIGAFQNTLRQYDREVWRSTHVVSDTSLMASEVVWEDFNHMRGRIVGPWLLDAASGAPQYERLAEYLCESNRCDPTDPNAGDHVA